MNFGVLRVLGGDSAERTPSEPKTTTRSKTKATIAAAFIIAWVVVVGTVHATVFPPVGGRGDRAEELRCPQGRILVGFHGKTGGWIDQIGLICATFVRPTLKRGSLERPPGRGGNGGARNDQYCSDDAAIRRVELRVVDEKFVWAVSFSCLRPRDGSDAGSGSYKGNLSGVDTTNFSVTAQGCTGSEYATGLTIRYGTHVNALGLICGPVQDPSGGFGGAGKALDDVIGNAGERIEPGMENNTDRPGWDYRRLELLSRDPAACRSACTSENDRCRAWTYVRPGSQGQKPVCYLKSQQPDAKPSTCCISGVNKKIMRLGKIPPSSPGGVPGAGMENDSDRPGSDIHRMELQEANPAICQGRCATLERCKAWTYVRPGVQGPKAVCYLKNAAPSPQPNKCCISGAKDTAAGPGAPSEPDLPSPSASRCLEGFVERKARTSDNVCVTEESQAIVQQENATAPARWDPNGPYGPNTCISGFVWREAFDGDTVCVRPERRAAVKEENRLGPSRKE